MGLLSFILLFSLVIANPPDWEDCPSCYQYTAVMNALVINGEDSSGDFNDIFAAFDSDGTVRGIGIPLLVEFGPYEGQVICELMLRSNDDGDIITFQYYDASQNVVCDIQESYMFGTNDLIGTLSDPHLLNINIDSCTEMAINDELLPLNSSLEQNYPNPFNPKTYINYTVSDLSNVTLRVYDIQGRLIEKIFSEIHTLGKYETIWDPGHLAAGVYFLDMKVYAIHDQLTFQKINKMIYFK